MDSKSIFTSKTMVWNILVSVLAIAQVVLKNFFGTDFTYGAVDTPETMILAFYALVNMVLRLKTSLPIGTNNSVPPAQ